ncbi:hypothetical protein KIN20_008141 [Parelaphostrongylus tenuis]|uniref:Uncharacterized protein n=1 Tax=Parelaphostrongylus tenuis TaxID=148309 RepID=A0AAD5MWD9_PARTN|nr:hypothetical protein KIN20_008141 [Parelaphostrongylus tenuis]
MRVFVTKKKSQVRMHLPMFQRPRYETLGTNYLWNYGQPYKVIPKVNLIAYALISSPKILAKKAKFSLLDMLVQPQMYILIQHRRHLRSQSGRSDGYLIIHHEGAQWDLRMLSN